MSILCKADCCSVPGDDCLTGSSMHCDIVVTTEILLLLWLSQSSRNCGLTEQSSGPGAAAELVDWQVSH